MLYYIMLYCIILCYVILYYITMLRLNMFISCHEALPVRYGPKGVSSWVRDPAAPRDGPFGRVRGLRDKPW